MILPLGILFTLFCSFIRGDPLLSIHVEQQEIQSACRGFSLYPVEIEASVLRTVVQDALTSIKQTPQSQQSPPVYEYTQSGWSWQIIMCESQSLTFEDLAQITDFALSIPPTETAGLTKTFVGKVEKLGVPVADIVMVPSKEVPIPAEAPVTPDPISPASPDAPIIVQTVETREIVNKEGVPQQDPDLKAFLDAFNSPAVVVPVRTGTSADTGSFTSFRRIKRGSLPPESVNDLLNGSLDLKIPSTGLTLRLHFWRKQDLETKKYIVRKTKVKNIINAIQATLNRIPSQVERQREQGSKASLLLGAVSSGQMELATGADVILQAWIDRNIDGSASPPTKLTSGLWVQILNYMIGWYAKLDPEGGALAIEGDILNTASWDPISFGKIRLLYGEEGEL